MAHYRVIYDPDLYEEEDYNASSPEEAINKMREMIMSWPDDYVNLNAFTAEKISDEDSEDC